MFFREFLEDIIEGRHVPSFLGEGNRGGEQQIFERRLVEVLGKILTFTPGEVRPFFQIKLILEGTPGDTQALCRLPCHQSVTPTEPQYFFDLPHS